VTHEGMLYDDPIKGEGQGHRGPKFIKMTNFKKSISSAGMYVIKRITVNCDTLT